MREPQILQKIDHPLICVNEWLIIAAGREGTTVVAVKTLKENASDKERSDLVQELQVMKMLEPHPNVVRLLGCCTEKGRPYKNSVHSYFISITSEETVLLSSKVYLPLDLVN
jgi:serine/threonine protein kinase